MANEWHERQRKLEDGVTFYLDIKNEKEHQECLYIISHLMDGDPPLKTLKGDLLKYLSESVSIYEKNYEL